MNINLSDTGVQFISTVNIQMEVKKAWKHIVYIYVYNMFELEATQQYLYIVIAYARGV